jgi:hypothetical protein
MIRDVPEAKINNNLFKQTIKMKNLKLVSEKHQDFTILCTMKIEVNSPIFNANTKKLQKEISDSILPVKKTTEELYENNYWRIQ